MWFQVKVDPAWACTDLTPGLQYSRAVPGEICWHYVLCFLKDVARVMKGHVFWLLETLLSSTFLIIMLL